MVVASVARDMRSGFDLGDADDADGALSGSLAHDHLARADEAAGQEKDDVLAAAGLVRSFRCCKLLPVELISDDEGAPAAPLKITLLEAFIRLDYLGLTVGDRGEHEAVVIV